MTSSEIRDKFLTFFDGKGHKIVPSAPIVLKNDPTLMFTNAGMNQFKDFFLGSKTPVAKRIADTQKCLRVSGKHNDLEEVGKDTYHHTMFEMLGNWSFGDYFKKEAIAWAWELLTEVYKIDKERLYATVFQGDAEDDLPEDEEALNIWKAYLPESRIIKASKKDNFWEMGETGPCGPCSEIHYDLRSDEERKAVDGAKLVNAGLPTVVEIWNLVFIQYNRKADTSLESLPAQHIDTGMGFERLCMVLQGVQSNYNTDVFTPLIKEIEKLSGRLYGKNEQTDIAMRVAADHIRAISFTIADGQLPSNTGAGYVIRRILRRAVRYGYSYLNIKEPFLHKLVPVLSGQFKAVFPELKQQQDFVAKVVMEEENSFLRTLEMGLKRLAQIEQEQSKDKVIPGSFVFELYDTFGFPADLTRLIAEEKGYAIDEIGFEKEMQQQKERSRKAATVETGDWVNLSDIADVEFVGYDTPETDARIIKYRKVKQRNQENYQVVLDKTPFYAESGGQIGDTGFLEVNGEQVKVLDTKKENELIVHYVEQLPAKLDEPVRARINEHDRISTANNHSATHLLHGALKQFLGEHVNQKGSYVGPDYLRFDFSHFEKVKDEQLQEIEDIVNEKIRANIPKNELRNIPIAEAMELGATALFGEKYGDYVRVIEFDKDFSIELCGGTHVSSTGQIGLFKITSESAVAAGVRRIEAITGKAALDFLNGKLHELNQIGEITKNNKDVVKGVYNLIEENNKLRRELDKLAGFQVNQLKEQLKNEAGRVGDIQFIGKVVEIASAEAMKNLVFDLKREMENLYLVLGTVINDKPLLTIAISENLVKEKNLNAGSIIREVAKEIKGGGGGQPFYATAGGNDVSGLDKAILKAKEYIEG